MPDKHLTVQAQSAENHLPYFLDYIPDQLRKKAKLELFEDEDTKIHSLRLLRSMLKDEPDLKWQDEDLFLLAFLRARKFDVKRAFTLVKTWYNVLGKRSELYSNFNFQDVAKVCLAQHVSYLPHRDDEGCAILLIKTEPWDTNEISMADLMRALTCSLHFSILSPATQIAGINVIFDFAGITLNRFHLVSPTYLWLFGEALQNCFPARFRSVHMINDSPLFQYVWAILKQPLKKKLRDRFHFHGKNYQKLHKYFSPSILPAEYGGEQPPFNNASWYAKFEEKKDYYAHVFSFGYAKYRNKADDKKRGSS